MDEVQSELSNPPCTSQTNKDTVSDVDRPLILSSEQLLQGRREVWIEHQGEMYRLRATSRGKLYLTK
jgi:hemin uptake protein HemP